MKQTLVALTFTLLSPVLMAADDPLQVWIDRPVGDVFVHGAVTIEVAVSGLGADKASVEFVVDGVSLGTMVQRPFHLKVDVGNENIEHTFEAIARTPDGGAARSSVRTPILQVDDQLELTLQQFYVTATESGRRVLDLERTDFRVVEEGEEQNIVTFERGDVPLTSVLLLDCSLSMTGEPLDAALEGASLFLDGMNDLDETMLMLYSDRLLRASNFTGDPAELGSALTEVDASGGTSINDHLYLALKKLDSRQGRSVVVLFSDGTDVHSVLSMADVAKKVRRSQALIYWIYLRLRPGEDVDKVPTYMATWRNVEASQDEFRKLRQAVQDSGGRVQVVDELDELDDAFVGIMRELREQYVIGYYPSDPSPDGEWRDVKVRVNRGGVKVRAREGYGSAW
jgi:Ca-activated chloride channel family protein